VHRHRAVPAAPRTPVSTLLATQLEARGHDLLDGGDYAGAVPVLRRAVAATGERLSRCIEPADTRCLTFAYALYDLGHALELGGDPRAAVPVLRERFEIDNQRPLVADQLAAARSRVLRAND
jgi:hypothetical protein